jgi:hypothetical protein
LIGNCFLFLYSRANGTVEHPVSSLHLPPNRSQTFSTQFSNIVFELLDKSIISVFDRIWCC